MASRRTLDRVTIFAHIAEQTEARHTFVPAGLLDRERAAIGQQVLSFAYGLRYLKRPEAFDVDPRSLSLEQARANPGMRWFPSPELGEFGGIRDAAPDAWGRRVIEARLKAAPNSLDEFTYLLEAGSDRVGALDVRDDLSSPPRHPAGDLLNLPYLLQAAAAVEAGEPVPAKLMPYLGGAPSAGGARPKASVRDADGVLWLAKFPAANDAYDMAIVEAGAMDLARAAGLTVPPLRILQAGSERILLVRRFDRYWAPPGQPLPALARGYDSQPQPGATEGRIPQVSALTMMGCPEMDSTAKSYRDLAQTIRERIHPSCIAADTEELFARMVLNIFVNNDDDHLRNHAFSYDAQLGGWRLSPLYDVVPRPSVARERRLHLSIGAQGKLATLDNAMSEFAAFVVDKPAALAVIRRVWGATRNWKAVFEAHGARPALIAILEQAIRPLGEVASPALERELRRAA
ncbi:type II toxin-antitoxin system HipA family toxin [Bordetella bronchiseptica]|nr:HipA domain-containing protein [Bordetella bronchiseptica]KCV24645.1 HipA-like C-terminal domain protein [Bordetella bronchiseptica 00-P-2730]AUL13944.1 phosphatidylinositol kinase [Bordetella bronchiseptica]AWP57035.1 phosphatidylinositol kinase [Bordetella bronchiseptica]KAK78617.1 HipA-like C-terminal domain protein [Bordetella bronchiseptica CA90 BB02]KCV54685.1 HipA-like C-terminal domain protein [Bordetella bronchiseptica 7E71]